MRNLSLALGGLVLPQKCLGLEPASKGFLGSMGQPVSSRRDGDGFIEQRGVVRLLEASSSFPLTSSCFQEA